MLIVYVSLSVVTVYRFYSRLQLLLLHLEGAEDCTYAIGLFNMMKMELCIKVSDIMRTGYQEIRNNLIMPQESKERVRET